VNELLARAGMRSFLAASGAEALLALREAARGGDAYDIALVDGRMPAQDGAALGADIKREALIAGTMLVYLSSVSHRLDATALAAPDCGGAHEAGRTRRRWSRSSPPPGRRTAPARHRPSSHAPRSPAGRTVSTKRWPPARGAPLVVEGRHHEPARAG
jgi:CheY-like chemotaxis protein